MNMSNIVSKSLVAAVVVPSEIAAFKMNSTQKIVTGVPVKDDLALGGHNDSTVADDSNADNSQLANSTSVSDSAATLEAIMKELSALKQQTKKAAESAVQYRKNKEKKEEEEEKEEKKQKNMFWSNAWMAAFVVWAVAFEFFAVDILKVVLFGSVVDDGFEGYVDPEHLGKERYFVGWTCGEFHHCSPRNYTLNCCAAFLSLVIMGVFLGLFCGLWSKCLAGQELCFGLTCCYPGDLSDVCACCNKSVEILNGGASHHNIVNPGDLHMM